MGRLLNIVTPLHKATKRDYLARMVDDKVHCMLKAKEYEFDYWDGDRRYGYGGYKFIEGRWTPVAKALIEIYGLNERAASSTSAAARRFLLYEMKKLLPELQVAGFDISKHGLAEAPRRDQAVSVPLSGAGPLSLRRQYVRSRHLARHAAQSTPVRTGDGGAGDRAGRQEQIHHGRGLSERARAVQPRMLGADRRVDPAYRRSGSGSTIISAIPATTSSSISSERSRTMKIKTAKAAILAQSREPLIVDEIELPEALDVGQVLVKVLTPRSAARRSTRSRPPRGRTSFCRICSATRPRPR